MNTSVTSHFNLLILVCISLLLGCDQNVDPPVVETIIKNTPPIIEIENTSVDNFEFNREDPRYLFDATTHTVEELTSLLNRADEVLTSKSDGYEELDIVLILHGPDINLFRKKNYSENKELVDLAAKLDAFKIIDMKICETAMSFMNVKRDEVPPFIESVPYAPAEIERLTNEGYFNL